MNLAKNLKILAHLRSNSREVLSSVSKRTGIPISTIHDRIKTNLGGYVSRYTLIPNYQELGFNARAYIILKASKDSKKKLQEHLQVHPNVNSVFRVNNGYDFLVECVFKNLMEMEAFLERVEELYDVLNRQVFYILDALREEEFLSDPQLTDLVMT